MEIERRARALQRAAEKENVVLVVFDDQELRAALIHGREQGKWRISSGARGSLRRRAWWPQQAFSPEHP
jgi:hypothetical protein